ncbi:MAG: 5-dehydro-2-deoxygluconokinase [Clostridia bacterium]|nr:5-dehydro-2-deoxygluconokinase [Clostridia bacterium]
MQFDSSKEYDIIPMGRVAIDFNPVDYFKTLAESDTYKKYLGGSPANIAVGLARLNKKVGFIGKVSADRFGDYVVDFFAKEGIDTSNIFRATGGEKLGLTFTEILSPSESGILMYREGVADLALEASEIDEEYIKKTKILLISGTALSKSPSREACFKALYFAKKHNVNVVFDIDYRPYSWQNADEIAINYAQVAEKSDILMGSREEFDLTEALIEKGRTDKESADYWLKRGNSIVIIKHGKKGSTAYTESGSYSIKPFPVIALKSFGGGDGYGSAFLCALLDGKDIMECLERGSASASMLVSAHGCSSFMPKEAEIDQFIAESKAKYGEMIARG